MLLWAFLHVQDWRAPSAPTSTEPEAGSAGQQTETVELATLELQRGLLKMTGFRRHFLRQHMQQLTVQQHMLDPERPGWKLRLAETAQWPRYPVEIVLVVETLFSITQPAPPFWFFIKGKSWSVLLVFSRTGCECYVIRWKASYWLTWSLQGMPPWAVHHRRFIKFFLCK